MIQILFSYLLLFIYYNLIIKKSNHYNFFIEKTLQWYYLLWDRNVVNLREDK